MRLTISSTSPKAITTCERYSSDFQWHYLTLCERYNYKDALKYGFYELQSYRDWYREVTQEVGMHADLVMYWMRAAALLIAPIAPHFAEHIWSGILKQPQSIQRALWPTPTEPVDRSIVEAGAYMRGTVKTIRDAELSLIKMMNKNKGKKGSAPPFDPKQPKMVRVYVASQFPEWQDQCVQVVKDAYDEKADKVDDAKVKDLLTQNGLIKDKRAMPFVQAFKVCLGSFLLNQCDEEGTNEMYHPIETHCTIRSTDSVPSDIAVR